MSCIWEMLGFDDTSHSRDAKCPVMAGTTSLCPTPPALRYCSRLPAYLSTLLFSPFLHPLHVYLAFWPLSPCFIHRLSRPASTLHSWFELPLFIFLTFAPLSSVSLICTSILFMASVALLISAVLLVNKYSPSSAHSLLSHLQLQLLQAAKCGGRRPFGVGA